MPLPNAVELHRIKQAERETLRVLVKVKGRKAPDPKLIKTFEDHLAWLRKRRAILKGDVA